MAKTRPRGQFSNIKEINPRNDAQRHYIKSIGDNIITFGIGPAGTGKTFLSVYQALCHLWSKKIRRIVITRPVMEAGEKIGFLPGDIKEKLDPYMRPIYDAIFDIIGHDEAKKKIDSGVIEIAPIAFMRGRTFNDSFILLDEAQNCTFDQLKMVCTRLGQNCHIVINGDPYQSDLTNSGFRAMISALTDVEDVGVVRFTAEEIERSEIVKKVVKALEEYERNK